MSTDHEVIRAILSLQGNHLKYKVCFRKISFTQNTFLKYLNNFCKTNIYRRRRRTILIFYLRIFFQHKRVRKLCGHESVSSVATMPFIGILLHRLNVFARIRSKCAFHHRYTRLETNLKQTMTKTMRTTKAAAEIPPTSKTFVSEIIKRNA